MYHRTSAPSEDSDRPAHSRGLIRIFTGLTLDGQICVDNEYSDQIARMRRLILGFASSTCPKALRKHAYSNI